MLKGLFVAAAVMLNTCVATVDEKAERIVRNQVMVHDVTMPYIKEFNGPAARDLLDRCMGAIWFAEMGSVRFIGAHNRSCPAHRSFKGTLTATTVFMDGHPYHLVTRTIGRPYDTVITWDTMPVHHTTDAVMLQTSLSDGYVSLSWFERE